MLSISKSRIRYDESNARDRAISLPYSGKPICDRRVLCLGEEF